MMFRIKVSQILQLTFFMLLVNLTWGQKQNPFELYHRLDKIEPVIEQSDTFSKETDTPIVVSELEDTAIPLDQPPSAIDEIRDDSLRESLEEPAVFPIDSALSSTPTIEEKPKRTGKSQEVLELPEVLQSRRNLIFSTFIILTLFLTVVISFNRAIVNKVMRSILNDNYLNLLYREQKGRWSMQFLFLYIFFIANFALLLFLMDDKWEMDRINANLLYLCGIIALIYFSRHFSLNLLGHTFPISKETGQFSFTIMLFNIFLGLVLLPINLFIAFAPEAIADTFIYIGIGMLGLFYVLRQLRGLFIGARFIMHSKFHFLLYLCTVEIAPMAVLYKFFQPFFI